MTLLHRLKARFWKLAMRPNLEPPPEDLYECEVLFSKIPKYKVAVACSLLKRKIPQETWTKINLAIDQFQTKWLYHLYDDEIVEARRKYGAEWMERSCFEGMLSAQGHFGFGMGIRNLLREEGCGEDYFGIQNLDDIYVQLLETAAADMRFQLKTG